MSEKLLRAFSDEAGMDGGFEKPVPKVSIHQNEHACGNSDAPKTALDAHFDKFGENGVCYYAGQGTYFVVSPQMDENEAVKAIVEFIRQQEPQYIMCGTKMGREEFVHELSGLMDLIGIEPMSRPALKNHDWYKQFNRNNRYGK